jgi:hypothetical protein
MIELHFCNIQLLGLAALHVKLSNIEGGMLEVGKQLTTGGVSDEE